MTEHQPENQRFILEQDGYTCVLDYTLQGDRINFTHTYVPFRLRGKGLAEILVRDALAWADQQGLKKEASCWYVANILNE
ncbi:GNAT family N-acetyltransferase [uncultured Thalassolituus sp.]|uniref:GNAT family N-acetyltransferase n=1 Tax=uncultured Thalassolituus sp. TaxID=285273 RepID=UPI00260D946D|nr:GNAT family N-acetyltransferase [uncultured Thalassolituus sp.]